MIEEIVVHEAVIAFRVVHGNAHIFIHVEGYHVLERYLSGTIGLDEGVVHTHGRRTGRQT